MNRDQNVPVMAVLVMMALLMGFVLIAQAFTREPNVYFLNRYELSVDYHEVYRASLRIAAGKTPYAVKRYVFPPLPAIVGLPLVYFSFDSVRLLMPLMVLASVLGSMLLLRRIFASRGW